MGDVRSGYLRASDLDHALHALAEQPLVPLAGCTDVYPARIGRDGHPPVIDIAGLSELRGIDRDDAGVRIGALTTWSDLVHAELPPGLRALAEAAREVGAVQVQNAGTLGGNLVNASPAADGVPPLLVMDAEVELASLSGRRRLPLTAFLTGYRSTQRRPDELLTAVLVPDRALEHPSAFVKLGSRRYLVISIAMVAVALRVQEGHLSDVRVAVGACSPVARRATDVEVALEGAPLDQVADRVRSTGFDLRPIDDVRGSAGYRSEMAGRLTIRAIERATAAGQPVGAPG